MLNFRPNLIYLLTTIPVTHTHTLGQGLFILGETESEERLVGGTAHIPHVLSKEAWQYQRR